MAHHILYLKIVVLSFVIISVSATSCSVLDEGRSENIFDLSILDAEAQSLIEVIPPAKVVDDEYIRVIENGVGLGSGGGDIGTFWFLEKQRLGDGFIATFEFRMNGPFSAKSDGFAFVAQNDKIEDIHGGNGANLGYKAGLDKYIAVGFNNCANGTLCNQAMVEVGVKEEGSAHVDLGSSFLSSSLNGTDFQTATISWLANSNTMLVEINGILVHNETVSTDLRTLWGDDFAYFGITASSSFGSGTDIDVRGFRVDQQLSAVEITQGLSQKVTVGSRISFTLSIVDTCGDILTYDESRAVIENASFIEASLTSDVNPSIVLEAILVEDLLNARYSIQFDLPETTLGSWTLEVVYNGDTLAQNNPVSGALVSESPPAKTLTKQNLIILSCIISILVLAIAYWIRRLYRFKKKLDENKDNIEAGIVVRKINKIEEDMTFTMSPLLGTLEEMQERLDKNLELLARYKRGEMFDSEYTITQLKERNEKLRAEMNRLKKEEQEKAALYSNSRLGKKKKKRDKMDFGQQGAE